MFRVKALRYSHSEFEPLGNIYAGVIAKVHSQLHSICIQQCLKAELYGLSFQDIVDKSDDDGKMTLRDLAAAIEARISLWPRDRRNESGKVEFFCNALLTEDQSREHLYSIGKGTYFCEGQTQLASALQMHEEVLSRGGNSCKADSFTLNGLKPSIFFTAPKYACKANKKIFPGSD